MLSKRDDGLAWATVNPPFSLIALMPSAPSLPLPERMTPMAFSA